MIQHTKFVDSLYTFNNGILWGNSGTNLIAVPDLANEFQQKR